MDRDGARQDALAFVRRTTSRRRVAFDAAIQKAREDS